MFGDFVMISPPLIIAEPQVDEIAERLEATLAAYTAELQGAGVRLG